MSNKRQEMRQAELEQAHHAEMGEHAEAALAGAKVEVLRRELLAEQTERFGFPPPTDALELNIAKLERKAAALAARDTELTEQLVTAQLEGRDADPGLTIERRALRDDLVDLTESLTVLRGRLAEGKGAESAHVVTDWLGKIAASEARTARAKVDESLRQIAELEEQLAARRLAVQADYLRGHFFADAAQAVHQAFPTLTVPTIERPASIGTEWQWEANGSPIHRLIHGDDLAGAVRVIPRLLAPDDQAQDPRLPEAIEALLKIHPPTSPDELNRRRREAVDAPHKEAILRVDAWLREQVAQGPVPVSTIEERAKQAGFSMRELGPDAPGWGAAHVGAAAQRLGVGPFVKYTGEDQDELTAATVFQAEVVYWATAKRVPGLMPEPEFVKRGRQTSAMRAS